MKHDYFKENVDTIYGFEQGLFAEMKETDRICKRSRRRRKALMWVMRRL